MIPTLLKKIEAQYSMQKTLNPDGSSSTVKCYFDSVHLIREQHRLLMEADKALLLAARWFKLNFDDNTLHEHPPSKADLAGMFDAMQEARELLRQLEESGL